MRHYIAVPMLAAALTLTSGFVFADGSDDANDIATFKQVKVTLVQAISAAETAASGKAFKAGFDHADADKGGGYYYEVEVLSGNDVFDVAVDVNTGKVIASVKEVPDVENPNG